MDIFKNRYFLFIAIFSFLKPAGFDFLGYNTINLTINILRIIVSVLIFIKYFYLYKKFSAFIASEFLLFLIILISTIYNGQDITPIVIVSVSALAFSCLIEIYLSMNFKHFINTTFLIYVILFSTNLVYMYSVIGFRIGSDEYFDDLLKSGVVYNILTTDNSVALYAIPALITGFLYSYVKKEKYNLMSWMLYTMILLTIIILWSATSIIGVFIILTYIVLVYENKKLLSYFNTKITLWITGLLVVGVTFFNIQNLFSFIIVDILQKDLSMTGRTSMWEIGFDGFYSSPLIGCGFIVTTVDNGLVQILFQGGAVGLIFLLLLMFVTIRKIKLNLSFELDKFFCLVLATVLIMSISESWFSYTGFYIILNFVYHVHSIQRNFIHFSVRDIR